MIWCAVDEQWISQNSFWMTFVWSKIKSTGFFYLFFGLQMWQFFYMQSVSWKNYEKSTILVLILYCFYFSGIHAREWISPATATYIMRELAENKNNADLIDFFDFYILPVANPDG